MYYTSYVLSSLLDVVGAWAVQPGGGQGSWRKEGHSANGKAQFKWRSYKGELGVGEAEKAGGPGWLAKSTTKETDIFVPFAFEVGGALGDGSEDFLRRWRRWLSTAAGSSHRSLRQ